MSEFIVGKIYEFNENNKRPDGTIDPFILNGVYKCTTVEEDGKAYFSKIRSHAPKLNLEDVFNPTHGVVDENGYRHFADGSVMKNTGYSHKPPVDPLQRQTKIVYFWMTKLNLALDEFQHCKQGLIKTVEAKLKMGHAPPDSTAIDKLQFIKAKVEVLSKKLKEEETKLEELEAPKTIRSYEAENKEVKDIIMSIEV
ncbi:MAG: hypothetical protein FVQ85_21030 [Planctomycetes bacterium]|nr:hypothetical protein [Planctomycetota bacterium]